MRTSGRAVTALSAIGSESALGGHTDISLNYFFTYRNIVQSDMSYFQSGTEHPAPVCRRDLGAYARTWSDAIRDARARADRRVLGASPCLARLTRMEGSDHW